MFTSTITKFAAVIALSTSLVAVGTTASYAGGPPKPLIGGLIGGGAGAGVGFALGKGQGALIGGLMGAALGAIIGDQVSHHDRHYAQDAAYVPPPPAYPPPPVYQPAPVAYEPPVYQPPIYEPPSPYGTADAGQSYCRQYPATATVGGVPQPIYSTACLQPNGTWRVVN